VSDTASDSSPEQPQASWSYTEVWTDSTDRAVVVLPSCVGTHRAGFDFQLTISSDCSAAVCEQIVDDRFTVVTDQPHVKVVWRVTEEQP
jgi:hypothetical protein